jgi:hypothetical protein
MERVIMTRTVALKDADRSFDLAFWQAQDSAARHRAAWELVEHYLRRKGRTDELRLQRTVGAFQRQHVVAKIN